MQKDVIPHDVITDKYSDKDKDKLLLPAKFLVVWK